MKGIALLEHFRPPEGFRTTGALVTTYSAELVACMALLISMDGGGSEKIDFTKITALRALERMRDRVRFVANANRIKWGKAGDPRIMAMFDQMLATVPFDCRRRSFHPKVIIARQESKGRPDRFVLYVGSRNLTSSTAWDLGIGLIGRVRTTPPPGQRKLQAVYPFAKAVLHLSGQRTFTERLGKLPEVSWELPEGVTNFDFGFHAGRTRTFAECALNRLPKGGDALILSPFLSASIVHDLCTHLRGTDDLRLVSGRTHLDKIAQSRARKHFVSEGGHLKPYDMEIAPDDASDEPPPEEEENDELMPGGRGLHAKVFAVRNETRCHMIVGSANLTNAAWTNENWEAFAVIGGPREMSDEVFAWASAHGQIYRPPPQSESTDEADPIDDIRSRLAAENVELEDAKGRSFLRCPGLPAILLGTKVKLRVARLTTPLDLTSWDAGNVEIPTCKPGDRTEFLVVQARHPSWKPQEWIQRAAVTPAITSERDREAFIGILGVDDFLRYLHGLMDGAADSEDGDEGNGGGGEESPRSREESAATFRLEELLRRMAKDREALRDIDQVVCRYEDMYRQMQLDAAQRARLEQFTTTWRAIVEGMKG